jgi:hypothetical protein
MPERRNRTHGKLALKVLLAYFVLGVIDAGKSTAPTAGLNVKRILFEGVK